MLHDLEMRNNSSSNCSISSFTPPDNPSILQSNYHILDPHNINISTLKDKYLDIIYLNNLLSAVSYV